MSTSSRLDLRLAPELRRRVTDFAAEYELGLSGAARLLIAQGLGQAGPGGVDVGRLEDTAMAGLVAAEQSLLLLAAVLPDGQRRLAELGEPAVAAAQRRLSLLTASADTLAGGQ